MLFRLIFLLLSAIVMANTKDIPVALSATQVEDNHEFSVYLMAPMQYSLGREKKQGRIRWFWKINNINDRKIQP